MDVMGYTVLQEETLPRFLKGRPQMTMCLACAGGLLLITALSITIGIFIGYTYCYLEHKSGIIRANITRTHVKIIPMHGFEYNDNKTRTINDALVNNFFVSKLLTASGMRMDPALNWIDQKGTEVPKESEETVTKDSEVTVTKVSEEPEAPKTA